MSRKKPSPETVELAEVIDLLTRTLLNNPLMRSSITPEGRLRVNADNLPIFWVNSNIPTSGAPAFGSANWVTVWIGPVDQRWMIIQMANMEYALCQRNRFTFV